MALGRQHDLIEVLREHRSGEESDRLQRVLAGVFEVVAKRRGQDEDTAGADGMRRTVFEIELTLSGNDVLRLLRGVVCQPRWPPGSIS